MYVRKMTRVTDDIILIQEHGPGRYGAPGEKRAKRKKASPEAVKEQNRRNRAEKIQLAILGNFRDGHHIVLGYPKGEAPEDFDEADRILTKFLDRVRRGCKKHGYPFRFIAATERGKRQAVLHHHMIIQDIEEPDLNLLSLIEKEWKGGRIHATATYEDDTMGRQLADYIVKSIDKDADPKGKYHISRNLKKPEVSRELVSGRIDENPEPPTGFQIVADTLYQGTNPFTGWPYQKYFLRRINGKAQNLDLYNNDSYKSRKQAGAQESEKTGEPAAKLKYCAGAIWQGIKSAGKRVAGAFTRKRGHKY